MKWHVKNGNPWLRKLFYFKTGACEKPQFILFLASIRSAVKLYPTCITSEFLTEKKFWRISLFHFILRISKLEGRNVLRKTMVAYISFNKFSETFHCKIFQEVWLSNHIFLPRALFSETLSSCLWKIRATLSLKESQVLQAFFSWKRLWVMMSTSV